MDFEWTVRSLLGKGLWNLERAMEEGGNKEMLQNNLVLSLRWGLKEREVTMRFSLSGWEHITTQNTNLQQWKFKNCTKICDLLKIYQ